MCLVVGLGNPGAKYKDTRHNVGFMVLDEFARANSLQWKSDSKFSCELTKHSNIFLMKPQTFMNDSGKSVAKFTNFHNIEPHNVLVVHDDIDLIFGQVKVAKGSGSAGHHGIDDIIEKLGTKDFYRMRIGVGRPKTATFEVRDWVLGKLSTSEIRLIKDLNLPLKEVFTKP